MLSLFDEILRNFAATPSVFSLMGLQLQETHLVSGDGKTMPGVSAAGHVP